MSKIDQLKGIEALKDRLEKEEVIQEGSNGKPRLLCGGCSVFVGLFLTAEAIRLLFRGSLAYGIGEICVGMIFFYAAYRMLYLNIRQLVVVTDRRLIWQKAGSRRLEEIPLQEIESARLFKSTVMFGKSHAGEVRIKRKSGKTEVLPLLANGEYVLEAVSDMLNSASERRQEWMKQAVRQQENGGREGVSKKES